MECDTVTPYLRGIPPLPQRLLALLDRDEERHAQCEAEDRLPGRDEELTGLQELELDKAVATRAWKIRLAREQYEERHGPVFVEPPPEF